MRSGAPHDSGVRSTKQLQQKQPLSSRMRMSFRATVVFAFAMIAGSTAAILLIITIFIFNTYFSSYTFENMEAVADYTAAQISELYTDSENGGSDEDADGNTMQQLELEALIDRFQFYDNIGMQVIDDSGQVVFSVDGTDGDSGSAPGIGARVVESPIISEGRTVGTVSIWMYGSDALMSQSDIQFRNNTVESLIIAGIISLLAAILLGIFFSNWIVAPIKRITAAANQLSKGDLSARTGMSGDNELNQLGMQFDRMAESIESDRMMELRLTSDVAHELRTPLMAVQSTVEAMIDGVYETDVEHLTVVDSEIRRLSHLVDALLRLSRLERRSSPLNEEVTDLGELAQTMVASHEVFVHDSGLDIEAHVDGKVLAKCDRDLIRQAVANLISNAVRYTPEGGRIDIYVHHEDVPQGRMSAIDVKDTGIGLTPEEAKMVFARFWRAEKRRSDKSGGLGIGLTVVKEIIDRHKGLITVEGEPGKGSTFSILLPAYDPDAAEKEGKDSLRSGKTSKGYKPIRLGDHS